MFILACNISIGTYTFSRCNAVEINKSNSLVTNTANITIPTTAVLMSRDSKTTIETAKAIKEGMPVKIELLYKNYEGEIFKGYVKRVNYKTPLEIECEDATYLLRKKNLNKSWQTITLHEVISEIIQGSGIVMASDPPAVNLAPYSLKNVNGAFALQKIKDDFGLTIYINEDEELYVGLAYTDNTGKVLYNLTGKETNVINADNLRYHDKDDIAIKVKAINIHGDNTRTEIEIGDDDGELRTLFFYNVKSKDELIRMAAQEIDKLKYDGYEGNITTFLIPKVLPGMKAVLEDDRFPERAGSYYVESVKTIWGVGGARREVELGIKLDADE